MARIIIKKPVISEKSVVLGEIGRYIFEVDSKANKNTVATAVKELFNVEVKDVNIINQKGKVKRVKRNKYTRPDVKKAVVTLKAGNKIALFEEGK